MHDPAALGPTSRRTIWREVLVLYLGSALLIRGIKSVVDAGGLSGDWLVLVALVFPWVYIDSGSTPPAPAPLGGESEAAEPAEKPRYVVLEPAEWVGQDVFSTPLAAWVDFESGELPIDGLFAFYRQTCEHCADHLMKLFEADVGFPMVLVKINEKGDNAENNLIEVKPSGPHIIEIELDPEIEWVIETPADLELEGGVVVRGEEGIGKD